MSPDTPPAGSPRDADTAQTLVRAGATLRDPIGPTVEAASSGPRELQATPVEQHLFATRYVERGVIGEGGMGEVRRCHDLRIGRDVALKIRKVGADASPEARARFLREARLQGQLEHPSIVPVYDMGAARDGEWFTMKRVRGETFAQVLERLATGDEDALARYSLRRLLGLLVQVCNAVAYAHGRGVVHRDLKPSNVMLGDYGEVYVLDWGVAKVLGTSEVALEDDDAVPTRAAAGTLAGSIIGTPGYMAPEQALGEIERIDPRTDVYALGAMLFEICTREALHPLHAVDAALASTLRGADARASVRAPALEIPPELDAICVRATAQDPNERYADAGALAQVIERFLDGDRDLLLRRSMADEQVERARALLAGSKGDPDAHAEALRALHRAYALDPTHEVAVTAMARLLLRPPERMPREAQEALERDVEQNRRMTARDGALAFAAWLALSPLMFLPGVRSVGVWLTIVATLLVCAAIAGFVALRKERPDDLSAWIVLGLSTVVTGLTATILGPFVLVPGWACQNTLVFAMYASGARRAAVVAIGTLALLVPFALELLGVVPASFAFEGGRLVLLPRLMELTSASTLPLLLLGNVAVVVVPSLIVGRLADNALATKKAHIKHLSWLRQLVPDEARAERRAT